MFGHFLLAILLSFVVAQPSVAFSEEVLARAHQEKIRWFNETKGYGWITPDDRGMDVFVHISAVDKAGIMMLPDGMCIIFQINTDGNDRESASNLRAC